MYKSTEYLYASVSAKYRFAPYGDRHTELHTHGDWRRELERASALAVSSNSFSVVRSVFASHIKQ